MIRILPRQRAFQLFLALLAALLCATPSMAIDSGHEDPRNFDARIDQTLHLRIAPNAAQLAALDQLRQEIPELGTEFDLTTGITRTIYNQTGYLTQVPSRDHMAVALDWVSNHLAALGLVQGDVQDLELTDSVYSRVTGATHIYLRQRHEGLPVYNGQLHVNVNREGFVISVNNGLMPQLAAAAPLAQPAIGADKAVVAALAQLGQEIALPAIVSAERGPQQITRVKRGGISRQKIIAQLMWLPVSQGNVRLVWNFPIYTLDNEHIYDFNVDAQTGQVWTRFDWVNSAQYRVYPEPVESPNHTSPAPPSDARVLRVNPERANASPLGWHDTGSTSYTIMRGNNVHAYDDRDANNAAPGSQPNCGGSLNCDFAINLGSQPQNYIPAAVANLFYWNNIIHDIQYQYGFDEGAGNFQVNNFGNGGAGNDYVRAEAQDGGGTCNANFSTPPDGSLPRMQMYVCSNASPTRDGDLDNAVIVHEYGHGISIRQVGGPGNSSCLNNNQQAGEGWSDWLGLVYTAEPGDQGTDKRGMGTYLFGQPANGDGIRPQPYSTSSAINNYTYQSINGLSIPHGVGSVWAQAIWEVYWALVDEHGFDADLGNAGAGAGNHRAMLYVNEGLQNTACSPTFTQNRDGILQAANDNFGGEDVCLLWETFAAFGLGTNAVSGGSNSTNPTNGFNIPASCACTPQPVANAGPNQTITLGGSATIGTPALAGHSYSWSPGGATTAQITVSPSTTTTYTVTATTSCGSATDSVTVTVQGTGGGNVFEDDFEGSVAGWSTSGLWHLTNNSSCASPGYSSATHAFYYGQDSTCNYNAGDNNGNLISPSISGITSSSELSFDYFRQVESYASGSFDRTEVAISTNGTTWTTVWARDSTDASENAWTPSGAISLAAWAGQTIQIRFRFDTIDGSFNTFTGWFIDDVVVTGDGGGGPGGECSVEVDFESGAAGWTNSTASTCSTGAYVVATPTEVVNGGVRTQLAGDHTTGTGDAFFTATNSSAGVNDVDGGNCIGLSPVYSVAEASEVSVWYFFGQRDPTGDASGDFFRLEISTNGGSTWSTMASFGDATVNATWTEATTTVPAGSSVQFRVQASDGNASGDLVEAGVDDVSICPL